MRDLLTALNISSLLLFFSVVRDVWRQQTLLQLLQVVEISMLDCILTSPAKPEPLRSSLRNHGDLVISNTCVDREVSESLSLHESVHNTQCRHIQIHGFHVGSPVCVCHSSLRRLDSWLVGAVDCLELFPDQLIVAASEQLVQQNATSGEGKHKRLLFDTIAKYYNSPERPPLVPGRYTDIQTGILHLLGNL